jgi:nucleoside-diphosphate-sugar epimerase
MKIFVAEASGVVGAQLVPELVGAGHQVVAMTGTASKRDGLRQEQCPARCRGAGGRAGVARRSTRRG